MKKDIISYLDSIGIGKTIQSRIEIILNFYQKHFNVDILDVFICEYVKEDGTREYESLFCFSDKYFMEAKQFLTTDDFDLTITKKVIYYLDIKKQDYDFDTATEKSRINLEISFDIGGFGLKANLKASGNNCDFLKDKMLKYFIPYFKN